jgi:hypothetical protein
MADSQERKNFNDKQKDVLKATQTGVTQSPKPKPVVTATSSTQQMRGKQRQIHKKGRISTKGKKMV